MELSPNEEPVWSYFDAQHNYILAQMREAYDASVAVIQSMSLVNHILHCLICLP